MLYNVKHSTMKYFFSTSAFLFTGNDSSKCKYVWNLDYSCFPSDRLNGFHLDTLSRQGCFHGHALDKIDRSLSAISV